MCRVLPRRVEAGGLTRGTERELGVSGQTLDIVRVAAVVALGLTLRVVEDRQTGHVVADLSSGQTVEVGPAVLPAVPVAPLQAGGHTRGLGLNTETESESTVGLSLRLSLTSVLIS